MLSESTPAAVALKQQTRSIPIVFIGVSDPVGSGLVASLARPGGDLTGMMQYESGIVGKWLAMLKEVAPRLARVAFIANPKFRGYEYFWRSAEPAAQAIAVELIPSQISNNAADIEHAIESFAQMPDGGLLFVCHDHSPSRSRHYARRTLPYACGLPLALLRHSRRTHVLRN
jgi:putative tryptophan/tyrosine transport system substrate-binding protein